MTEVDDNAPSAPAGDPHSPPPPRVHRAIRAGLLGALCAYSIELEYSIEISRTSGGNRGLVVLGMMVVLVLFGFPGILLALVLTRIRAAFATWVIAVPATVGIIRVLNYALHTHSGLSTASPPFLILRSTLPDVAAAAVVFGGAAWLTQPPMSGYARGHGRPARLRGVGRAVARAGGAMRVPAGPVRGTAATALFVLMAAGGMTYRWYSTETEAPVLVPLYASATCTRADLRSVGGAIPADFHPEVCDLGMRRDAGVTRPQESTRPWH
jgi:hypothetical protein